MIIKGLSFVRKAVGYDYDIFDGFSNENELVNINAIPIVIVKS